MNVPVIALPLLHKDEALRRLCPQLRWVCPGLPVDDPAYLVRDWPLDAAEAALCLREVEHIAASGLTGEEARSASRLSDETHRNRQEAAAIRETVRAHEGTPGAHAAIAGRDHGDGADDASATRQAGQRLLLMAWAQEERLAEIRHLSVRYANEARRLGDMLREGDSDGQEEAQAVFATPFAELTPADERAMLPAWRPVLERLALFVPEDAVLYTYDPRLIESLRERGLCMWPLEGAEPEALAPLRGRLYGERLPMWRILGYTGSQAGRPRLDREYLMLLCPEQV